MAFDASRADGLLRRRIGSSDTVALVLAALALVLGAAAWMTSPEQTAPFASVAIPSEPYQTSFEDRFHAVSTRDTAADKLAPQPKDATTLGGLETKLWDAKALLAQKLMFGSWRSASADDVRPPIEEAKPLGTAGIPLPRPRPVAADTEAQAGSAVAQDDNAAKSDNRSLLQKLSDLLPGRITLASLAPETGLFRPRPDLASLGYDNLTAVYDISARVVYLPNGASLEAHSGMGSVRDDPEHVNEPNIGATPPAVYELKAREKLFHGVRALRMVPADGNTIFGRSGLLAHSYMLGAEGDSNGCVSIKNYEQFLKAFEDGEINRLVVVPSLSGAMSTSQRPSSQS